MNLRRSGGGKTWKGLKERDQKDNQYMYQKITKKKAYLYISDFWLLWELSQGQGPFK